MNIGELKLKFIVKWNCSEEELLEKCRLHRCKHRHRLLQNAIKRPFNQLKKKSRN